MAVFAIGDVQGCFPALQQLLDQIHFDLSRDRLWFVGDLVNRGPQSAAVLRFVKGLGSAAVTVLGNHDLHLLAVAEGCARPRRQDTLQDILHAPDRDELLDWLRQQRLIYQQSAFVLVHAGLLPQWTVAQAVALGQEVEQVLRGAERQAFLHHLYQQTASRWSDGLTGMARLATTARVLTHLRVCSADGAMDFSYKGPPGQAPQGLIPWFQIPDRRHAEATIVCGHWAAMGLQVLPNLLALDGGCVWGRKLVAIRLEDRQISLVSCAQTSSTRSTATGPGHQLRSGSDT